MRLNTLMLAGLAGAFSLSAAQADDRHGLAQLDQSRLTTIEGVQGPDYYQGVSVDEGAIIDLDEEVGLDGYLLRSRFEVVEPGGVVKLHQHKNRPAFTYVVNGAIHEYRSDDTGAGERAAGAITTDSAGLVQWWKNDSDETIRLYVVDLVPEAAVNPDGRD